MTDWFRSWHGAPTDMKWLVIAKKAKVAPGIVSAVWFAVEDHASQQADRGSVAGFNVEGYAAWSGFPEKKVSAVISAMAEKGIIVDGRLAAWDRRQPKREERDHPPRGTKPKPSAASDSAPQFPTFADTPPQSPPRVDVVVESDQRRENNDTTTAREAPILAVVPEIDLAATLAATAGAALGDLASYPGLASLAEPNRWLEAGCDLRLDVLPTVHRLGLTKKPGSVRSWTFFSEAVFEARDKRSRGPPAHPVIIDIGQTRPKARTRDEFESPTRAALRRVREGG